MRAFLTAVFAFFIISIAGHASPQGVPADKVVTEVRRIMNIEDDEARLRAYDFLASRVVQNHAPEGVGAWTIEQGASVLDDSPIVSLSLDGGEATTVDLTGALFTPTMTIKYLEGKILVGFNLRDEIHVDPTSVMARFDGGVAQELNLKDLEYGLDPLLAKSFVTALADSRELVVIWREFSRREPFAVTFSTSGIRVALEPFEKAAGWNPSDIAGLVNERLTFAVAKNNLGKQISEVYSADGNVAIGRLDLWSSEIRPGRFTVKSRMVTSLRIGQFGGSFPLKSKLKVCVRGVEPQDPVRSSKEMHFSSSELGDIAREAIQKVGLVEGSYQLVISNDQLSGPGVETDEPLSNIQGEFISIEVLLVSPSKTED